MTTKICCLSLGVIACGIASLAQETLMPLNGAAPPATYEELWGPFDPRAEPLDVEVLKEWEVDGVVLKVLRYRVGIFKGQKAMVAAVYGYPKGGENLPGLVQIHGGGQYADYRAPLNNARRGYATISISWAGRINAPDYKVSPAEVKLFWEGKTDDPRYRVTTDWGALDGYHAPTRSGAGGYGRTKPSEWTIDAVESARNNPWFLSTMAARRALTFLERRPEVDPARLGVYGHSMGGKLTVLTAGADPRVKAAAPSCGGVSSRSDGLSADQAALVNITCPILFQSPANDFHGRLNDLQTAMTEIQSTEWRVTCAPHHNHQDTAEYEVASQLWFDQHLKGAFAWPATPELSIAVREPAGKPVVGVVVDDAMPIAGVDVYYTRHGQMDGKKDDRENTKARFWHHAAAREQGGAWAAPMELENLDQPLWVYANVTYKLKQPVSSAGYYYRLRESDRFVVSSRVIMATAQEIKDAGMKAAAEPSLIIEDFKGEWRKEWFGYTPEEGWGRKTHKVYDSMWQAPKDARLALDVRAAEANTLVVGVDSFAAELELKGGAWQSVALTLDDFKDAAGAALKSWDGIRELRLDARDRLRKKVDGKDKSVKLGGAWKGAAPEFRDLRWVAPYVPEEGSAAEMKRGRWAIELDPALPNVLILGDSISIGYTLSVRKALAGKANVFRPHTRNGERPENCVGTSVGVREIDRWLAGHKWDVIHFNWGLHDLKHVNAKTGANSKSFDDPQQADPDAYGKNLAEMVEKLKATGATLIFATTTPYPDGVSPARLPADAKRYNDIALEIMKTNGIQVNDLCALVEGRLDKLQRPKNVHFNQRGNAVLSARVAECVEAALSKEK